MTARRARLGSLAATAVVTLSLAGCAIPAATPGVAPLAPATLGLSTLPAPTIAASWWRDFGDPQLDRIVAAAIDGKSPVTLTSIELALAPVALASRVVAEVLLPIDATIAPGAIAWSLTLPPDVTFSPEAAEKLAVDLYPIAAATIPAVADERSRLPNGASPSKTDRRNLEVVSNPILAFTKPSDVDNTLAP